MIDKAVSLALRVQSNRPYAIADGERGISPDTAPRFGWYFGTGPEFCVNLQGHYDLPKAQDELEGAIEREIQPRQDAAG